MVLTEPALCDPCSECNNDPKRCFHAFPYCQYNSTTDTCQDRYTGIRFDFVHIIKKLFLESYTPVCEPCSTCDDDPLKCFESFPYCIYDDENNTCRDRFSGIK